MLTENFTRQMAGMGAMEQQEQDLFAKRRSEDEARQAQLGMLDSTLMDQEAQASEVERSLRESGFADVAERFKSAQKNRAFQQARQGIYGQQMGSAAAESREQLAARADQEAQQVAEQSRLSALEQVLKAQQQRDRLAQEVLRRDPMAAAVEGRQTQGVLEGAQDQARIAEAVRNMRAARDASGAANIGSAFNIVGSIGEGVGNIAEAEARSRAGG
jgi:hypothetical protein